MGRVTNKLWLKLPSNSLGITRWLAEDSNNTVTSLSIALHLLIMRIGRAGFLKCLLWGAQRAHASAKANALHRHAERSETFEMYPDPLQNIISSSLGQSRSHPQHFFQTQMKTKVGGCNKSSISVYFNCWCECKCTFTLLYFHLKDHWILIVPLKTLHQELNWALPCQNYTQRVIAWGGGVSILVQFW